MLSLATLDAKISTKRREVAALVEKRESAFAAIDAMETAISALEANETPTEAQIAELATKLAAYKADRTSARKMGDEVAALQSEVAELERDRADRAAHNATAANLEASKGRTTTPEAANAVEGTGKVNVLAPTADQMDHDISSFVRNTYIAKYTSNSFASVCAGAAGDQYKNDRLHAAVNRTNNAALLPENYVPRLIELLRPKTVVRNLPGVRHLPLINGNLRIPRQSGASSANYVGEQVNMPVSDVTTDSITANSKKLTVVVVQSGEIMRQSSPATDKLIRDDIVKQLQIKEDSTFLRHAGSSTIPKGIKAYADALAGQAITSNQTVNLANVTTDIGKLILLLQTANVSMDSCVFLLSPRSLRWLMDIRDGNGNPGFPELSRGVLREYPFRVSNQIPTNLTVGAVTGASEVYFLDASELIIADAPTFELGVSLEAAYHDGTNVVAAFTKDEAVFRLMVEHDTACRHNEAMAYLTDVTWGKP